MEFIALVKAYCLSFAQAKTSWQHHIELSQFDHEIHYILTQ